MKIHRLFGGLALLGLSALLLGKPEWFYPSFSALLRALFDLVGLSVR